MVECCLSKLVAFETVCFGLCTLNLDMIRFFKSTRNLIFVVTYGIRIDYQKLDSSSCQRWRHEGWWYYPVMYRDPEAGTRNRQVLSDNC